MKVQKIRMKLTQICMYTKFFKKRKSWKINIVIFSCNAITNITINVIVRIMKNLKVTILTIFRPVFRARLLLLRQEWRRVESIRPNEYFIKVLQSYSIARRTINGHELASSSPRSTRRHSAQITSLRRNLSRSRI